VRQLVARLCDKLTGCEEGYSHRHAGNPEVGDACWNAVVSVLTVKCAGLVSHHRIGIETFGLWHVSGYQKGSKQRCCDAARRGDRSPGTKHVWLRMNHLATLTGWG
jgi:hypothetical protein